jgi:hypothetical protein
MAVLVQMERLNHTALSAFPALFAGLESPQALLGDYRAAFTGPAWLRHIARPGLWPLGLGGWWGKHFTADGSGMNLVRRGGELRRIFPIRLVPAPSLLDGRPCLSVRYKPECPYPWPHVVDELRSLDERTLLGMTMVNTGVLRKLALPFLLFKE